MNERGRSRHRSRFFAVEKLEYERQHIYIHSMNPRVFPVLVNVVTFCLIVASVVLLRHMIFSPHVAPSPASFVTTREAASVALLSGNSPLPRAAATTTATSTKQTQASKVPIAPIKAQSLKKPADKPKSQISTTTQASSDTAIASRVQNPYNTPPESFDTVNVAARSALVNVLCQSRSGALQPISGSGVIIDPRGVILTNAHVAQYVLLSEDAAVDLSCVIRTGSPARDSYTAEVLYIPPAWVDAHAQDIKTAHALGTGEHDYALLRIVGTSGGSPLPAIFPYLPYDTREAVAFQGDSVLGAAYPAEFIGGALALTNLNAVSSVSQINQLLTFGTSSVDVLSLGGVIEAQSGSSGGPVANAWGYLVGIITTTSEAATTAQRDLRAITIGYIDRDLRAQTDSGIESFLQGDLAAKEADFNTRIAPALIGQYIKILTQ